MKKVAIIGAGASGLLCAIECAKSNCSIDLFEQNSKCAKKILVSGNGRCNITNKKVTLNDYYSENIEFIKYALDSFPFTKFEKFTSSIGLVLDSKDDSKVYPLSNEAKTVASLFLSYAKNLGVNVYTDTKIVDIKKLFEKYDFVVVATGSEAGEHLGGNGDGYKFAEEFGHSIVPTYPSLVQLHLNGSSFKKMSGTKIEGEVTLFINNKVELTTKGDILFTNYGVSGFAILDISQVASEAMKNYQIVDIKINLLPRYNAQNLSKYIMKIVQNSTGLTILELLYGILATKIAKAILDELNLVHTRLVSTIDTKLSKKIANQILNWKFEVIQTHGFRYAEVSGGGVDTTQIDSKTMQSLKQKNLYFCGEVLDVVGRRGGFNFAWAWASGYLVAKDITNRVKND